VPVHLTNAREENCRKVALLHKMTCDSGRARCRTAYGHAPHPRAAAIENNLVNRLRFAEYGPSDICIPATPQKCTILHIGFVLQNAHWPRFATLQLTPSLFNSAQPAPSHTLCVFLSRLRASAPKFTPLTAQKCTSMHNSAQRRPIPIGFVSQLANLSRRCTILHNDTHPPSPTRRQRPNPTIGFVPQITLYDSMKSRVASSGFPGIL